MNWHEIEVDYWSQRLCQAHEYPEASKVAQLSPTRIIESIDQFVVLVMVSNRLTTRNLLPVSEAIVDQGTSGLKAAA